MPPALGPAARPAHCVAGAQRPVARARKARLVLKRVDPWSVFLYSVVASIFIGVATVVAVGLLYAVLSKLGVLSSLNTLIGDVTADPGTTAAPGPAPVLGRQGHDVRDPHRGARRRLITALATLGAFLYNVCAALTGGIEVTVSDQS